MNSELVADMQRDLKAHGINLSREQVYQHLVKYGFIDKLGNPTPWALERGFVTQIYDFPNGIERNNKDN